MADITGGRIKFTLHGEDVNLGKILNDMNLNAQSLAKTFGRVDVVAKSTTASLQRHQSVLLSTAQAQARLAAAQGQPAQAARILQSALGQVNTTSIQSINASAQLAQMQTKAANGAHTLTNSIKGLGKELGLFGALFIGQQLLGFTGDLIKGAGDLEKAKATIGALSKSQEEYAATLKLASDQQKIFGGSMTENLRSLGAFVNLSQRTGVQLKDLENLSRRLAIIDPIQGFEGAAVALKEFFSGDITSLNVDN